MAVFDTLRDFHPVRFATDVRSIPLSNYDLVISDYEPVSAWSAKLQNIPSVGLSHQAAFLSPNTPRPQTKSLVAEALLQHFAPVDFPLGFHFQRYDDFVEPPIIRKAIRQLDVTESNHITVYLPAYHHEVLQELFAPFSHVDWHIFSPSCTEAHQSKNCLVYPVSNGRFLDSFASCRGVISNAGFETCAEAMYLGKKLLAIPIKNQYEQACNVAALQQLGVKTLDSIDGRRDEIWKWLEDTTSVFIDEIADPQAIVHRILDFESEVTNRAGSFFQAIR